MLGGHVLGNPLVSAKGAGAILRRDVATHLSPTVVALIACVWAAAAVSVSALIAASQGSAAGSAPTAVQVVHFNRLAPDGPNVRHPQLLDVNGDGILDVLACKRDDVGIGFFRGKANGTFAPGTSTPVGDLCFDLVAAQLDDGNLDLAVLESDTPAVVDPDPELVILRGHGDGTFEPGPRYPLGDISFGITSGDFDDDGAEDLALTETETDSVAVFPGNGDATFGAPSSQPVGRSPVALAASDMDGNGTDDLITVNRDSGDVSLLPGQAGGLGPEARYGSMRRPHDLVVADVDGDGHTDLGVVVREGVRILTGDGAGTLTTGPRLESGRMPIAASVADFNSDQVPDVAVAWHWNLGVYFGRGQGRFTRPTAFTIEGGGRRRFPTVGPFTVGDLDRDGRLDILSAVRFTQLRGTGRLFTCRGETANLVGSRYQDYFFWDFPERRSVVVAARNGDDRVGGSERGDLICLGRGLDGVSAGAGGDTILAGKGAELHLHGESGDDLIAAGPGDDLVGRDRFTGEGGDDRLRGGGGRDFLNGGAGLDHCVGGGDRDDAVSCEEAESIP
jgi:hypothetical protein